MSVVANVKRVPARFIAAVAIGATLAVIAVAGPFAQPADAADHSVSNVGDFALAVTEINATGGDHTITLAANIDFTDVAVQEFSLNGNAGVLTNVVIDGQELFGVFCDSNEGECGTWINNYIGTYGSLTIQDMAVEGFGTGAIYSVNTDLTVTNSTFQNNLNLADFGSGTAANGAAINDNSSNPATSIVITNSTFRGNYANAGNANGGALNLSSPTTITGSTFEYNVARGETSSAFGGMYFANLEIEDSTFTSNEAYGVSASASMAGGAIFIYGAYLGVTDSLFEDNEVFGVHATSGDAGAVYVENSGFSIADSIFSDNRADDRGGAVAVEGSSGSIEASAFYDNYSTQSGGAVSVNSTSSANVYQSLFKGNQASRGGALGVYNSSFAEVMSSTFTENESYEGAAVGTSLSTVELNYSTISGNIADEVGDGGNGGGQIQAQESNLYLHASVLVDVQGGGDVNCSFYDAAVDSDDYNFVDDESCGLGELHDVEIADIDPQLGPLKFNGGPTHTMLPEWGSPLIDEVPLGDGGPCITEARDQRDVSRPQGDACDIGAVETFEPITGSIVTPGGTVQYRILNAQSATGTYVALASLTPAAPAGVAYPYGAQAFDIDVWGDGWPADIQIFSPAPSVELWKLWGEWIEPNGATSVNVSGGTLWTYRVTDDGFGDNDNDENGFIEDPVAMGVTAVFAG